MLSKLIQCDSIWSWNILDRVICCILAVLMFYFVPFFFTFSPCILSDFHCVFCPLRPFTGGARVSNKEKYYLYLYFRTHVSALKKIHLILFEFDKIWFHLPTRLISNKENWMESDWANTKAVHARAQSRKFDKKKKKWEISFSKKHLHFFGWNLCSFLKLQQDLFTPSCASWDQQCVHSAQWESHNQCKSNNLCNSMQLSQFHQAQCLLLKLTATMQLCSANKHNIFTQFVFGFTFSVCLSVFMIPDTLVQVQRVSEM